MIINFAVTKQSIIALFKSEAEYVGISEHCQNVKH